MPHLLQSVTVIQCACKMSRHRVQMFTDFMQHRAGQNAFEPDDDGLLQFIYEKMRSDDLVPHVVRTSCLACRLYRYDSRTRSCRACQPLLRPGGHLA